MATRKPRWVGSKEIKVDPNYPEYTITGATERYTFIYTGPFLSLIASKPGRGTVISGYAGYTVSDVKVKPSGAGVDGPGVMMFSIDRVNGGGAIGSEDDQTVVEIDAGSLEKSVLSHPRFAALTAAQAKQVRDLIDNGLPLPNPDASPTVTNYYQLIKSGVESYLVSAPVVRFTSTTKLKPNVGKIGVGTRTAEKPHISAPDGYEWLKTGDRAQQTGANGTWERIQEWTGADGWSEWLYGPQT